MIPEDINNKIAEALGWAIKTCRCAGQWDTPPDEGCSGLSYWKAPVGWIHSDSKYAIAYRNSRDGGMLAPPDYYGSLEAMHEAEKILWSRNDWSACRYEEELKKLTHGSWEWHTTSAQRAEAFLKALGLWEENS